MNNSYVIEYIWLDGSTPTQQIRSKIKVLNIPEEDDSRRVKLRQIPVWNFDGSSTCQSGTNSSDLILNPVYITPKGVSQYDNNYTGSNYIVMCEVLNSDGTPHSSNNRAELQDIYNEFRSQNIRVGFEQEYFMKRSHSTNILGWNKGPPRPQGDYYCGVGSENVEGRRLMSKHLHACLDMGININGTNAEVALGQWEYQIGGVEVGALQACDELWVSRFILEKIGESLSISIDYDPKPVAGDWNGSGMHTNFSTSSMRSEGGIKHIHDFSNNMGRSRMVDMALSSYGEGLERRLTGEHETASINEFSYGELNRGCSIRIPVSVVKDGCGYLEDRRPNSNADPYKILNVLVTNLIE